MVEDSLRLERRTDPARSSVAGQRGIEGFGRLTRTTWRRRTGALYFLANQAHRPGRPITHLVRADDEITRLSTSAPCAQIEEDHMHPSMPGSSGGGRTIAPHPQDRR